MKFKTKKENIINELQSLAAVADKKQTLPVLSNVLIKCEESSVKLQSTDLEVELEVEIFNANIEQIGEITIPAKKVADIVRELPDGEVCFDYDDGSSKLTLRSKAGRYSFSTISAGDFPEFDSVRSENIYSIHAAKLLKFFQKTSFAMGSADWRHFLNGSFIEKSLNSLKITTTDSHRLAQYAEGFEGEGDFSGIIPRKTCIELMKILSKEEGEIQFYINDNNIAFMSKNFTFKSKLIDGNYPDVSSVIPDGSGTSITLDRKDFINTLSRVSVLSNDKFKAVKLLTHGDKLQVSAHNPSQESAEEELKYSGFKTDEVPFDMTFNVNYLRDVLSTIEDDEITIIRSGKGSLIKSGDPNQIIVLMPLLL